MRFISVIAAGAFLLGAVAPLSAAPVSAVPGANATHITLVQEKKDETITQKVKRTWKRWTTPSHTFCARCLLPPKAVACTAQAKDRETARANCQQRNPICVITDDMRGCG